MRNANANGERGKKNQAHRISTGVISFVRMWMRTANVSKWIAACSNQSECECFVGREIPSYTGPPQSSTCLAQGKLHWSHNRIHRWYSHYTQVESLLNTANLKSDIYYIINGCWERFLADLHYLFQDCRPSRTKDDPVTSRSACLCGTWGKTQLPLAGPTI